MASMSSSSFWAATLKRWAVNPISAALAAVNPISTALEAVSPTPEVGS